MEPYHSDPWLTVYQGDCREVMATMGPESVHCVVTSPPYWGLRDYGTATWIGGDEGCRHERNGPSVGNNMNVRGKDETAMPVGGWDKATVEGNQYRAVPMGGSCVKCGAIREDSQLGLEPTPEAYVESMVAVFREVKRVLRHDGTVWLNIGDSYASSAVSVQRVRPDDGRTRASEGDVPELLSPDGSPALERGQPRAGAPEGIGLPPSPQGAPERADHRAALRVSGGGDDAAGLEMSVLRRDDAGVPDARSRPERRLQGSPDGSASDLQAGPGRGLSAGAVSDPLLELQRGEGAGGMPTFGSLKQKDLVGIPWMLAFALRADGWYLRSDIIWSKPNPMPESVTDRPTKAHEYLFLLSKSPRYYYDADAVREPQSEATLERFKPGSAPRKPGLVGNAATGMEQWRKPPTQGDLGERGRNLRSVWTVATQPYPGAHFATFPEKLVEPCILAGTSAKGVCPECGAPWTREVEVTGYDRQRWAPGEDQYHTKAKGKHGATSSFTTGDVSVKQTTGWRRSCDHGPTLRMADTAIPATVLDPFAGSGTVGRVAARLSRRAVLIDLNAAYLGQAMKRNQDIPLGLETGT